MWFKMGMDIMNCSVMRELGSLVQKDNKFEYRKLAFIHLLSLTATGAANDLQNSSDLARIVDATPKQAQIVWDICIKHGVLRRGEYGYSATQWMIERNILGDFRRKERSYSSSSCHYTNGNKTSW